MTNSPSVALRQHGETRSLLPYEMNAPDTFATVRQLSAAARFTHHTTFGAAGDRVGAPPIDDDSHVVTLERNGRATGPAARGDRR